MATLTLVAVAGAVLTLPAQAQSKTEVWTEEFAARAGYGKESFTVPSGFKHISSVLYLEDKFIVLPPGLGEDKDITMLALRFGLAFTDPPDKKFVEPAEGRCSSGGDEVATAIKLKHYPRLLGDVALALDCARARKTGRAWETAQLITDGDTYLMVVSFDRADLSSQVYVDLTDWVEANW